MARRPSTSATKPPTSTPASAKKAGPVLITSRRSSARSHLRRSARRARSSRATTPILRTAATSTAGTARRPPSLLSRPRRQAASTSPSRVGQAGCQLSVLQRSEGTAGRRPSPAARLTTTASAATPRRLGGSRSGSPSTASARCWSLGSTQTSAFLWRRRGGHVTEGRATHAHGRGVGYLAEELGAPAHELAWPDPEFDLIFALHFRPSGEYLRLERLYQGFTHHTQGYLGPQESCGAVAPLEFEHDPDAYSAAQDELSASG
mmetsp:Transcript_34462/g.110104  ORF Transcript_34462/g.110104 Transcript_34462/m.110104 type:complete len:262 (+) Transcript_34462:10-795(+)